MPLTLNVYPARSRRQIILENAVYTAIAVSSSLIITAVISLVLHDRVRFDFMLTAFLCSFSVSVPMTALFQRLNRELEDALRRERELLLREERLRALRETMSKAQHFVNNLANSLHLVELEYKKNNSLSAATLAALQGEIQRTGQEMQRISEFEDGAAAPP
jgi:hypothetical protein